MGPRTRRGVIALLLLAHCYFCIAFSPPRTCFLQALFLLSVFHVSTATLTDLGVFYLNYKFYPVLINRRSPASFNRFPTLFAPNRNLFSALHQTSVSNFFNSWSPAARAAAASPRLLAIHRLLRRHTYMQIHMHIYVYIHSRELHAIIEVTRLKRPDGPSPLQHAAERVEIALHIALLRRR